MARPFLSKLVCAWLLTCPLAMLRAASWEHSGDFLFHSYGSKAYGLSPQNWAVVQDRRGILYFGNTEGMLEFDGVHWRAIRLPNNGPVRSLALDDDGNVLVGGQGEIGYLAADDTGNTRYVSLLDSIPQADRTFGSVWSILNTSEGIVFSSYERLILRPVTGAPRVWRAPKRLRRAFLIDGKVHLVMADVGLHRLDGNQLVLVPGGEALAKTDVRGAYASPSGTILVTSKGLLRQTGTGFVETSPALLPFLKDNSLYSVLALADGITALGTTRGGVILLDASGAVVRVLNRASGLPSEYVAAMAAGREGGIWLATDNGIARFNPRLSRFDESHGLKGSVISLANWKGTLYAGTTTGLFRLRPPAPSQAPAFETVPQLQERVFVLVARDDGLWAGTQGGVYFINETGLKKILAVDLVYDLSFSPRDPARLYTSGRFGAIVLRKEGNEWKTAATLAPGGQELRTIGEDPQGNVWITTLIGTLRADFSQTPPKVTHFSQSDGLPDGWKNVFRAGGRFGIASEKGLRTFNPSKSAFVPEPAFGAEFADGRRGTLILRDDPQGNVWITGPGYHGMLTRQSSGAWSWKPMPFLAAGIDEFWAVQPDPDGVVWASSPAGFLARYQPSATAPPNEPFRLMIRRLQDSDTGRVLFGGRVDARHYLTLPYSQNALRFDFAAPFFDDPNGVEYQTMLEGGQAVWSGWTRESWRDLSNLWEGRYRLHVRARNAYGQSSNEATYGFRVLPPWYRTWWAYFFYGVTAVGLTSLIVKWRLYQLRESNRKLEQIVEERTVEIRLQRDQIKEQEEKSEALLLNILPAPVAKELLATGSVEPMQFDDVTVCFTDFVGFTVSSEKMEAQAVVAQLDKYFTEFDRIVTRYGLEKLKTIGDAYMFVSGLPQPSPSHAVDAVLAALEILEKAKELAQRPGGTQWRLRVGLHSGPVVAGVVGVRKFAFDIWGDTVNLASRMESSGIPDRVNLSAHTHSLVRDFIECEPRGHVRTKDGRDLEMFFAQRMRLATANETATGYQTTAAATNDAAASHPHAVYETPATQQAPATPTTDFQPAYERQYHAAFGHPPRALPRDGVRDALRPVTYK